MKKSFGVTRREFLQSVPLAAGAAMVGATLPFAGLAQEENAARASAGGPENPQWSIVIPPANEPGEPLVVSGTIYAPDGATPVEGARLYVYHTDARGYYSTGGRNERQPRLRGWMKTRADGRYQFRTIRPASYPNQSAAAHIHATLSAPGYPERWIEEFLFEGDRFLTRQDVGRYSRGGRFASIQKAVRDADGVWRYERDLRLER